MSSPDADGPTRQPESVSLWVNDHKLKTWAGKAVGAGFSEVVDLDPKLFRAGPNVLVAQAHDRRPDASRGESAPLVVAGPPVVGTPKLHGLFVGVADFSGVATGPNGEVLPDLRYSVNDAQEVRDAWKKQVKSGKWAAGTFTLLAEKEATPEAVVKALRAVAKDAAADDLVVFHLSGHGWGREAKDGGKYGREAFAFVGPKFDLRRYQDTGLTSETLYDELAAIPARKLLLLDACHSGGVATDGVRALTPEGRGPPMIAAARPDEVAFEHPAYGHSLLSKALIDALTRDFAAADRDHNDRLEADELGDYAARKVPELLARLDPLLPPKDRGKRQQPQVFPPAFAPAPAGPRPVAWLPAK